MPTVDVNGASLYYELSGDGPPVVLIHGLGSSTHDWSKQVPALAQAYRVCVLGLRGHGRSARPPGPYSIRLFAEDVAALMHALGLVPAHLVGVSLGGMIALQLALLAGGSVRSLVIVNSGPGLPGPAFAQWLVAAQRLLLVRILGLRKFGAMLASRLLPEASDDERQAFAERWGANDPRAYRAAVKALIGWNVTGRLGEITVPALVVAADHDYTPLSFKQNFVGELRRGTLTVIENSRHAVPIERPEQFNEVVLRFLESVDEQTD